MRETKTSRLFSRIKLDTPGPWQYRSRKPHSTPPTPQRSAIVDADADVPQSAASLYDRKLDDSNSKDMTLADIADFSLRAMVAQLMAVAPAIPVRELYHLIIDSKGHLPTARKQAIRMSEAPIAHRQSAKPPLERGEDDDEIMVKIDPNDPAFEWDTDEPPLPEPASKTKACRAKPKPKPTSKPNKARSLQNLPTKRRKPEKRSRPNIGVKRTKSAPINPTHARETSFDREFVVPDYAVHLVLSDSDEEHAGALVVHDDSDIEMIDEPLDLSIDMRPTYAYNSGLLGKIQRRGRR
jgi:outer membrane biosynthesis protein TonB